MSSRRYPLQPTGNPAGLRREPSSGAHRNYEGEWGYHAPSYPSQPIPRQPETAPPVSGVLNNEQPDPRTYPSQRTPASRRYGEQETAPPAFRSSEVDSRRYQHTTQAPHRGQVLPPALDIRPPGRDGQRYPPQRTLYPSAPPRARDPGDPSTLDNWHHGIARTLPDEGGSSHSRSSVNVPLSAVPEDLTSFIREKDTWANKFGGFADVWKCALHREGKRETVAVKCIRFPIDDQSQGELDRIIQRFRGEVHIWVRLPHHDHVLRLYGIANNFGRLPSLVSPWAENGTLTSYLDRTHGLLSYDRKRSIILQVAEGLLHLHNNRILHGDLTGSNILINKNEKALISDFGLSSIMAEFNYTTYFRSCRLGAIRWTDPALLHALAKDERSDIKATAENDIYSLGCIILQVITGLIPYHNKNDLAVHVDKVKGKNPSIPSTVPPALAGLIEGCWSSDIHSRPTLPEIASFIKRDKTI